MSALGRFCAVVAWIVVAGAAVAETTTFSGLSIGSLPAPFETALTGDGLIGFWAVVQDDTAQGGRALEQRTPDPTDYRFPLAVYRPVVTRDLEVTTRFKAVAGRVDQAGGIAIRLLDADNYYVVRANALEGNVRFYKVIAGKRQQLAGANLAVTSNQWHELVLRAEGERFTVTFNGKELFAATDRTIMSPGKVAFWTKADSITRFDSLEIKPLQ
jgi:hypothetical protein